MIVVLLWLLALVLIVVVLVCWFVVLFLLIGQRRPKTKHKKTTNPLFYSVLFAVVITDLWPQKGQQPKAIKKRFLFYFLFEKAPFCRKKRLALCC